MECYHQLAVDFCGCKLINPFVVAASPPSDSREKLARAFEAGWAGAVLKTTSVEKEPVDLVYPMMSGISYRGQCHAGFFNIDLISERHIDEIEADIRYLKERFPDRILIGSIMAGSKADWEELVERLEAAGADMIECSMSCPQGEGDGKIPGADPELLQQVTSWIVAATRKETPVIVKLTPNVTDLVAMGKAAAAGGAAALCAIDTVKGLSGLDLTTGKPLLAVSGHSSFGGLSGPMIKPIALSCVAELAQNVSLPIAGVGGITNWQDAAEFLLLGAGHLQVCTAIMRYGFELVEDLCEGLANYMEEQGFSTVGEMVGKSLPYLIDHDDLSRMHKVVSSINYDLCIGDNKCFIACRDGGYGAIFIDEDRNPRVDETKCRGCGVCLSVCPASGCLTLKSMA